MKCNSHQIPYHTRTHTHSHTHTRSIFKHLFVRSLTRLFACSFVGSFTCLAYSHTQFNIQRYTLNQSGGKGGVVFLVNIFVIPNIFYMVEFAQFFLIWVLSPAPIFQALAFSLSFAFLLCRVFSLSISLGLSISLSLCVYLYIYIYTFICMVCISLIHPNPLHSISVHRVFLLPYQAYFLDWPELYHRNS